MRSALAAIPLRVRAIVLTLVTIALVAAMGIATAQAQTVHAQRAHLGSAHAHRACAPTRAAAHPRACAELRRRERRAAQGRRRAAQRRRHAEAERARHRHLLPACEDGSAPSGAGGEGPACADGSEPQCPVGSTAKLSATGTILGCVDEPEPSTAFDEESCEGGPGSGCGTIATPVHSTPPCPGGAQASADGEGEYRCPDGSEPHCEEGMLLTLIPSDEGTSLVCETPEDPAREES